MWRQRIGSGSGGEHSVDVPHPCLAAANAAALPLPALHAKFVVEDGRLMTKIMESGFIINIFFL